jgi:hypothetical protein
VQKRNPKAEEEISFTISHYLAADSFSFSHAEDPCFHRLLQKARQPTTNMSLPKGIRLPVIV